MHGGFTSPSELVSSQVSSVSAIQPSDTWSLDSTPYKHCNYLLLLLFQDSWVSSSCRGLHLLAFFNKSHPPGSTGQVIMFGCTSATARYIIRIYSLENDIKGMKQTQFAFLWFQRFLYVCTTYVAGHYQ